MSFFSRILGISRTAKPSDAGCWQYAGGRIEIDLNRAPELNTAGTAVRLEGGGLPLRILVTRDPQGGFHALHNRCTHAGRRLDMLESGGLECCSVNKSKFDFSGDKTGGPAKGPVKTFPVSLEDKRLTVFLGGSAS